MVENKDKTLELTPLNSAAARLLGLLELDKNNGRSLDANLREKLLKMLNDSNETEVGSEMPTVPATIGKEVQEQITVVTSEPDLIWDKYQNPSLKKEFAAMNDQERQKISRLTEIIIDEASAIGLIGKRLGVAGLKAVADHHYFNVHCADQHKMRALNNMFKETLNDNLQAALAQNYKKSHAVVSIADHPTNRNLVVVILKTLSADGTGMNAEHRACHFNFTMIVQKDGELIDFLRSGQNGRLFVYALRNAAIKLNSSAQKYLDVPLMGRDLQTKGNAFAVQDCPNRTISYYSKSAELTASGEEYYCETDLAFMNESANLYIGSRNGISEYIVWSY